MRKNKFLGLIISIVVIVTVMSTLTGCIFSKSYTDLLIGTWSPTLEGTGTEMTGKWEFKKDGTMIITTADGEIRTDNYKAEEVEGDKPKINVTIGGDPGEFTFVDDDTISVEGVLNLSRVK